MWDDVVAPMRDAVEPPYDRMQLMHPSINEAGKKNRAESGVLRGGQSIDGPTPSLVQ